MTGDFFLTQWFFLGMRWLCGAIGGNVFLTILISTVTLRLLTLFSDIKQRQAMAKNAELQPELEELQRRYKNNPEKLQQEQTKLMKEKGGSVFAGCLPLLLTIPLLFCFIAAFRFWGYEQTVRVIDEMSDNIAVTMKQNKLIDENATTKECIDKFTAMEEQEKTALYESVEVSKTFKQSKFLWINNIWQPDNGFAEVVTPAATFYASSSYKSTKKLIYFKEHPEAKQKLVELGIFYDESEDFKELKKDEQNKLKESAQERYNELTQPLIKYYDGYNNGWFILPVLATVFQLIYAVYTQKQNEKNQSEAAKQANQSSKFMMYLMPVLTFIFCLSYTSAFAIYWTLSSMTMLVVNIILTKVFSKKKSQ